MKHLNAERRLLKQRQYNQEMLKNESPECKKKSLLKQKQYKRRIHQNETSECRDKRLFHKRQKSKQSRQNESAKSKTRRLSKKQSYLKHKRSSKSVSELITKFHTAVSEGPMYICTCCNQLWYKHSVCSPEKTRQNNVNMIKHLQNIISVNDTEWIC